MKSVTLLTLLLLLCCFAACDLRSGIAKEEMEKFSGTPTPTRTPEIPEAPIDPKDSITVDTTVMGDAISIDGGSQKKAVTCKKFDRVAVNGSRGTISIKGPCRQLMVNGNNNEINAEALMDIVVNGEANTIKYTKYVNAKRPTVKDNEGGNTIEKVAAAEAKK